jgi:cyanophycin synthetase
VSVDVTDQVCPALRAVSEQICDILHAGILGIDIMTEDLGQPLDLSKGWGVVEVNGSPGYSLHSLVHVGQRRDPVKMIVDEWEKNMAA